MNSETLHTEFGNSGTKDGGGFWGTEGDMGGRGWPGDRIMVFECCYKSYPRIREYFYNV